MTIPTAAERTGNFSAFPNTIFDPTTTVPSGTSYTRTRFGQHNSFRPFRSGHDEDDQRLSTAVTSGAHQQLHAPISTRFRTGIRAMCAWITRSPRTTILRALCHPAHRYHRSAQLSGGHHRRHLHSPCSWATRLPLPALRPTRSTTPSRTTRTSSPTLINDLRVGFNRFRLDYTLAGTTPTENSG